MKTEFEVVSVDFRDMMRPPEKGLAGELSRFVLMAETKIRILPHPQRETVAKQASDLYLELKNDITVTNYTDAGGLIQAEMIQTSDPGAGKLILGFDKEPFALKKWRIIDAQELITEVELFYLKTDIKHESGLFVYKDPDFGTTSRLNR